MKLLQSTFVVSLVLLSSAAMAQSGAVGTHFRRQIVPPPTNSASPAAPSTAPHPQKAAIVQVPSGSRIVSASYLRMNEPDVLLGLADGVRAGKVARSELDDTAGRAIGQQLMDHNVSSTMVTSQFRNRYKLMPGSGIGQFLPDYVGRLPAQDYGPANMGFDLDVDKYQIATFHVISPTDGTVNVHLSTTGSSGNFVPTDSLEGMTIVGVSTYTGVWETKQSTTQITPLMFPVLDQTREGAGSLPIKAGQELVVEVRFGLDHAETDLNGFITVTGGTATQLWDASAMIQGDVRHPDSVDAVPSATPVVVQGHEVDAPFEISSVSGQDLKVTLSSSDLPQGVTMNPVTVDVPHAPSPGVSITLHIVADETAPQVIGVWVPVTVTSTAPGFSTSITSGMTLSVYETIHEWTYPEQDNGFIQLTDPVVGIKQDGGCYLTGMGHDTGLIYGDTAILGFYFEDGTNATRAGYGSQKFAAKETAAVSITGTNQWVSDNYVDLVQKTPQIIILDEESGISASDVLGLVEQAAGAVIPLL